MYQTKSVKVAIEGAVLKSKKLKESIVKANWNDVVGEISKKSKLLYVKDQVGYVLVESPVFLQHMRMNKEKYIKKSNTLLNIEYLIDFKFKVGHVDISNYFSEDDVREFVDYKVQLSKEELDNIYEFTENIENDEIKEKIINLKIESLKREKCLKKNGYKKCRDCTTYFLGEGSLCMICKTKKEQEIEKKILKNFEQNLFLEYEEAKKMFLNLDLKTFNKIKQIKLDKIYRKAKFLLEKDLEKEAKHCLYDYFRLETNNKNFVELEAKSKNLILTLKKTSK